jgi:hypothetical protein
MKRLSNHGVALAVCAIVLAATHSAAGQSNTGASPSQLLLPTSPSSWLNSPPLTTQMLKGKAAVFYLYEEG